MAINIADQMYENAADTPALALEAGETLNLSAVGSIFAAGTGTSSAGIVTGGGNDLNLQGGVFSMNGNGIRGGGNHTISIGSTASIYGAVEAMLFTVGGNTITNAGQVTSNSYALSIGGAGSNDVVNTGILRSGATGAVSLGGTDNTFNNSGIVLGNVTSAAVTLNAGSVTNSGTIQGGAGVVLYAEASLNNSGTIKATNGDGLVVLGSNQIQTITNTGLMRTDAATAISLQGGQDTYDGRGGRVIGAVEGGAGMDTLWGGIFVDRLEGGTENDHINGGGGGDYIDGGIGYDFARYDFATTGVQARLDNAALNTGEAAGDTMYNFEGLVGSQFGDILVGNNLAIGNQIYGLGGNDTIRGLGGADILYGNAGADSIFTGDGTDTVYVQAADLIATQQDRVFDFTDGQDHLRFQGISAASATITDSQGGTLIQFNVAGGQFSVFLDGITKAASADQIFFV